MRLRRVRTIAAFEFRSTVWRWSFFIASFGLPILLGTVTGASAWMQSELVAASAGVATVVGVVDEASILDPHHVHAPLVPIATERTALDSLRRGRVDEVCILGPDWRTTGAVRFVVRDDAPVLTRDDAEVVAALSASLRESLALRAVDEATLERLVHPIAVERQRLTVDGLEAESSDAVTDAIAAVAVPMLLGLLLMSSLLMASGYLVQTIAQDKETKIVEVLLSSATADELLAGKLVGLGAAGLFQFGIWAAFGSAAVRAMLVAYPHALAHPPVEALAFSPLFFLLGYAFLGSVMLATGAFGSSAAESQKLVIGWVLLAIVPLLVLPIMLESPHGIVARVLTYVPFCTPITIVVRLAVDGPGVAGWEVAFAAVDLIVATMVSIYVGGRLFRVGLLLTGTLPSLRAIVAQARSR